MKTIVCLMNIRLITLMKDKAIQFQGIRQRILFSKAKRPGILPLVKSVRSGKPESSFFVSFLYLGCKAAKPKGIMSC